MSDRLTKLNLIPIPSKKINSNLINSLSYNRLGARAVCVRTKNYKISFPFFLQNRKKGVSIETATTFQDTIETAFT